jgi:CPA1 family monovalent cation:H+ antiporter
VTAFETLAALLTIAAAFAYFNHRLLRLPTSIALMAMALAASCVLIVVDRTGLIAVSATASQIVERMALHETLLHGVLGLLLFAGALHIDLNDLREERVAVAGMALGATILSTFLVGGLTYLALGLLALPMSFGYCLLFGSLISPTDPIAVLGIVKRERVPRNLEIQIAGESLFNDGVGVVIFITVLGVVAPGSHVTAGQVAVLFAREAVGGALFGLVTGYVAFRLIRSIDHYQTELLITLALVLGGYAVAERLHISAPIAAVVAGLLIGNQGRSFGMSDVTRDHLDKFWSLIDEILNALLFVVVGLEVVRLSLSPRTVLAGLLLIPIVLVARFASVGASILGLGRVVKFPRGALWVHTWGGLRGGISVALALSLPVTPERDVIVTMTYFVVVFSILVQGLTLGRLARRFGDRASPGADLMPPA